MASTADVALTSLLSPASCHALFAAMTLAYIATYRLLDHLLLRSLGRTHHVAKFNYRTAYVVVNVFKALVLFMSTCLPMFWRAVYNTMVTGDWASDLATMRFLTILYVANDSASFFTAYKMRQTTVVHHAITIGLCLYISSCPPETHPIARSAVFYGACSCLTYQVNGVLAARKVWPWSPVVTKKLRLACFWIYASICAVNWTVHTWLYFRAVRDPMDDSLWWVGLYSMVVILIVVDDVDLLSSLWVGFSEPKKVDRRVSGSWPLRHTMYRENVVAMLSHAERSIPSATQWVGGDATASPDDSDSGDSDSGDSDSGDSTDSNGGSSSGPEGPGYSTDGGDATDGIDFSDGEPEGCGGDDAMHVALGGQSENSGNEPEGWGGDDAMHVALGGQSENSGSEPEGRGGGVGDEGGFSPPPALFGCLRRRSNAVSERRRSPSPLPRTPSV